MVDIVTISDPHARLQDIVSKDVIEASGCGSVVERIRGVSSTGKVRGEADDRLDTVEFEISDRADLLVFELVGQLLHSEGALSYGPDARERFLAKNGTVIPSRGIQQA
eukprot:SAG31_NODE_5310_length_2617_cov_3.641384_1_plen_108_part_00